MQEHKKDDRKKINVRMTRTERAKLDAVIGIRRATDINTTITDVVIGLIDKELKELTT